MGKTKTAFVGETIEEPKAKNKKPKADKVHIAGLKGGQRVKVVETGIPTESPKQESNTPKAKPGSHKTRVRSKKYQEAKTKVNRDKLYAIDEAIKLVQDTSYSKFDGTIELHLVIRKQGFSTNVILPYSTGKQKKIEIADEATIKKLANGKIDFDILLATPDIMPKLVPFAKLLGPKGLMPNPKNGTLVKSAKEAEKFSGNSMNIKTEKEQPVIHTVIGKVSQPENELKENISAIARAIDQKQILKAYLKSTMSPSVKLKI